MINYAKDLEARGQGGGMTLFTSEGIGIQEEE
jgi:hypothetical protein